ncbi:NAD-dependent epimerase/dehydratase family protein [Nannocystaceae bacterium ST9]
MSVVVTGASGHLGANLVRELIARGESVRALVHRSSASLAALGVEQVAGSVTEPAGLPAAFAGATRVYHLAGVISLDGDPDGRVRRVNVEGTANVARACREVGVARLVHVSSVHAFDQRPLDRPLDETRSQVADSRQHSAYDRSKAASERVVREAIGEGLDAVIVNPTGILGHVDHGPSRLGQLLLDLAARRMPALLDGGFDFVDVRDVVAGTIAAGDRGQTGANYILGNAWYSLWELAASAGSITGVPAPRLVTPVWTARLGVPIAKLVAKLSDKQPAMTHESLDVLISNRSISSDKAKRELDYRPRALAETLRDAYRWFAEQGMLDRRARARVLGRASPA